MNVENILKVADAIERHEIDGLGFNMVDYFAVNGEHGSRDMTGHGCGTCACIAGWTDVIANPAIYSDLSVKPPRRDVDIRAAEFMGIEDEFIDPLFLAYGSPISMHEITTTQAVAVLRHLAATGEVDWSITE